MKDLFGQEQIAVEPPDGDQGREERGSFYTPDALALAICRTLRTSIGIVPRSIFEPGCGGGAFLRAAKATWPDASLLGVDLVPACKGPGVVLNVDLFNVHRGDATTPDGLFDLVLGNPDFSIAERVVRHGLTLVPEHGHVALLLLSSFEESLQRIPFWSEHPLWVRKAIGFPRPCFRADGATDMRPYALYLWRKGWTGPDYTGLRPLVWK